MFRWPVSKLPLLFILVLSLTLGISFVPDYTHADIAPPRPSPKPSPRPEPPPPADYRPSTSPGGTIALNYFSFGLTTGELFAAMGGLLVGLETIFLVGLIKTRKRKLDE
ncbi:MAG: hypothetical protein ACLPVO_06465 [Desulfomonilaceae bacterium]